MSEGKMRQGTHPNSLKNLRTAWNSETAKEAQLKSAAARSQNAKIRDEVKHSLKQLKELKSTFEEAEDVTAVDFLKLMMHQKMNEGDTDQAIDIAKHLSEFEKPKLARVEQKVQEVSADELSDEELNARLAQFYRDSTMQ